jgi:hypothetical protein
MQSRGLKGNRLVQSLGELGAISTARKLGMEPIMDFPTRVHGIDGLFRHGDKIVIVEAKGGAGRLAVNAGDVGQMSQEWINRQITNLQQRGEFHWAGLLKQARDSRPSRLQGLVVNTRIDGSLALNPEFTLKNWEAIGPNRF